MTSIDLFCGAGGITAGFELVGFRCVYANDCNPSAIETFKFNHPKTLTDPREIEGYRPSFSAEAAPAGKGRAFRFDRRPAMPGLLNKRAREVFG